MLIVLGFWVLGFEGVRVQVLRFKGFRIMENQTKQSSNSY